MLLRRKLRQLLGGQRCDDNDDDSEVYTFNIIFSHSIACNHSSTFKTKQQIFLVLDI